MSSMNSIRDMFFEEAEELLEALSEGLEQLCSGHRDDETVNAVFRAVHSIKGGAGAFNLTALVAFAHRFETVLDEVRSHRLALDDEILVTLQRSADHLADLVVDARDETSNFAAQTADFLAALDACLGEDNPAEPEADLASLYAPVTLDLGDFGGDFGADLPPAPDVWTIAFRPHPTFFGNGLDPAMFLSALAELGETEVEADLSQLPDLEGYDPEQSHLGWTIRLATTMPESLIRDVFEFAEGLCDLVITPEAQPAPEEADPVAAAVDVPAEVMAPTPAETTPEPPVPVVPAQAPVSEAADGETNAPGEKSGPKPTLRVDLDRVDRLINAVGELIINQSMIAQRLQELRLADRCRRGHPCRGLPPAGPRHSGSRDGDPRPAGETAVPAHVADRARGRGCDRQIGAACDHRRGDRGRQDRDRTAGRPVDPHDPQRGRSRAGTARGPGGRRQGPVGHDPAVGRPSVGWRDHHGARRRRRAEPRRRSSRLPNARG